MSADGHDWCRHYNGTGVHKICDAGVDYDTVKRTRESGSGWDVPCTNPKLAAGCVLHELHTPEEFEERNAHIRQFIEGMNAISAGTSDTCPHCGKRIERMKQIGRCVYVYPCGDRLWQGTIPKAWRDRKV